MGLHLVVVLKVYTQWPWASCCQGLKGILGQAALVQKQARSKKGDGIELQSPAQFGKKLAGGASKEPVHSRWSREGTAMLGREVRGDREPQRHPWVQKGWGTEGSCRGPEVGARGSYRGLERIGELVQSFETGNPSYLIFDLVSRA